MWRQANRFPGDSLLVQPEPGRASFDLGPPGWVELRTEEAIDAARLIEIVGDVHRRFVQEAMLRAQLVCAQQVANEAAAILLGRGSQARLASHQSDLHRIGAELAAIAKRQPGPAEADPDKRQRP